MSDKVGTRKQRINKAIHLHYTTKLTYEEIGERLGVSASTVRNYLNTDVRDKVEEMLDKKQAEYRVMAVQELRRQLQEAGHRSRTAEKPVKIYENEDGYIEVYDVKDDKGKTFDKKAVPDHIELLPDEKQRFYGRQEAREILEEMRKVLGIDEQQIEFSGEIGIDPSQAYIEALQNKKQ